MCLIGRCIEEHAFSVYIANVSSISSFQGGFDIPLAQWPTVAV